MLKHERRYVPKDWLHPRDAKGVYIPLRYNYGADLLRFEDWSNKLANGLVCVLDSKHEWVWVEAITPELKEEHKRWCECHPEENPTPDFNAGRYMPRWLPQERTHVQLYETDVYGVPVSPVFPSDEDLDLWMKESQ